MPEYLDPVKYLGNQQNHQKAYEFERDIIRAKNSLNADFNWQYDGLPEVVPALSTVDMERYKFRRYVEAMISHVFNQVTELKFGKAHEAFTRNHPDVIDDPYLINEQIWLKLPRIDDPTFQRQVHDDCYVGLVSKFGANRVVQKVNKGQLDPNTPLYMQLINEDKNLIDDAIVLPKPPLTEPLPAVPATMEEATLG